MVSILEEHDETLERARTSSGRNSAYSSSLANLLADKTISSPVTTLKPIGRLELHIEKRVDDQVTEKTMVVLCTLYRAITQDRTKAEIARIKDQLAQIQAAMKEGDSVSVSLFSSKRMVPLATLRTEKQLNPKTTRSVLLLDDKALPEDVIEFIATKDFKRLVVATKEQLMAIAPIAARLGIKEIYAPKGIAGLVDSPLVKSLGDVAITKEVKLPMAKEAKRAERSSSKSLVATIEKSAMDLPSGWDQVKLPALSKLLSKAIDTRMQETPNAAAPIEANIEKPAVVREPRTQREDSTRIAMSDKELLDRLMISAQRDLNESGPLVRDSLKGLHSAISYRLRELASRKTEKRQRDSNRKAAAKNGTNVNVRARFNGLEDTEQPEALANKSSLS